MGRTKKKSFYAVARGRTIGIYSTWEECKAQVDGFSGARYKGFSTLGEAKQFLTAESAPPASRSLPPHAPTAAQLGLSFLRPALLASASHLSNSVIYSRGEEEEDTRVQAVKRMRYSAPYSASPRLPPQPSPTRLATRPVPYEALPESEDLEVSLNTEQRRALALAESGFSMFLTGCAGTGKSFLLGHIIERLRRLHQHPDAVAVTASTGVAACNIGGVTLHRWTGIGLGDESIRVMLGRAFGKKKQWQKARVLIIDEISMISAELFDKVEYIARRVRNWHKNPSEERPFGGLQVICCGDFFQLPPVIDNTLLGQRGRSDESEVFAFSAESWPSCIDTVVQLTEVFRQKDERFQAILNQIREGSCSDHAESTLNECFKRDLEDGSNILPTKLCPTNREVDDINRTHIDAIECPPVAFRATDELPSEPGPRAVLGNWLDKGCIALDQVELKIGAQVMLIKNITSRLANGSRGVVVGWATPIELAALLDKRTGPYSQYLYASQQQADWFAKNMMPKLPRVRFVGMDEPIIIGPMVFSVKYREYNHEHEASRCQIPLKLAWAVTIHKCQGMSLDRVEIRSDRIFASGQAYVALSRVRSLEGLCLYDRFRKEHAIVNKAVVEFYRTCSRERVNPASVPKCRKSRPLGHVPRFVVAEYDEWARNNGKPLDLTPAKKEEMVLSSATAPSPSHTGNPYGKRSR